MATTDPVDTPEQAHQEFWLRLRRTFYQVAGGFTAIAGPLTLAQLRTDDLITTDEAKTIAIAGGVAAASLAVSAIMNYFKPVQTNP